LHCSTKSFAEFYLLVFCGSTTTLNANFFNLMMKIAIMLEGIL
jgi:hypothetical protein